MDWFLPAFETRREITFEASVSLIWTQIRSATTFTVTKTSTASCIGEEATDRNVFYFCEIETRRVELGFSGNTFCIIA
jgi:hypothetical protein